MTGGSGGGGERSGGLRISEDWLATLLGLVLVGLILAGVLVKGILP
jgi:hypothetical protein